MLDTAPSYRSEPCQEWTSTPHPNLPALLGRQDVRLLSFTQCLFQPCREVLCLNKLHLQSCHGLLGLMFLGCGCGLPLSPCHAAKIAVYE